MAGSEHRTGSAILHNVNEESRTGEKSNQHKDEQVKLSKKKDKKHQQKQIEIEKKIKQERNRIVKGIVIRVILCVGLGVFFYAIYTYASRNNCKNIVWNYLSEYGVMFVGGDIFVLLIEIFFKCKRFGKENRKYAFVYIFLEVTVVAVSLLFLFILFKVKATVTAVDENVAIAETGTITSDSQMSPNEPTVQYKDIVKYKVDEDPFMDSRPLSDYCGRGIIDEDKVEIKAGILLNNMDSNKPEGSRTEIYNGLLEAADGEYSTYLFQREYAEAAGDNNAILYTDRIEMLQRALDNREEAEREYNTSENERLLATGYRDMGDEFFGRGRQKEAMSAYEKSAEWFMNAVYHAAAMGDYDEMQKSMQLFEKLGKEVEKLDEINSDRKERIMTMIEVYRTFMKKLDK